MPLGSLQSRRQAAFERRTPLTNSVKYPLLMPVFLQFLSASKHVCIEGTGNKVERIERANHLIKSKKLSACEKNIEENKAELVEELENTLR